VAVSEIACRRRSKRSCAASFSSSMSDATRGLRVVALEYHDVVGDDFDASGFPGKAAASYKLSVANFTAHISALAQLAARVVQPESLGLPTRGGPAVVLTFDDGGISAFTHAAPILESHGLRGVFFITTDRIGTAGFLTSDQIRELARRGHTVGSHSCSHPVRMAACTPSELAHEWRDSVRELTSIIGTGVVTASVPGGFYSRSVASAAAAAGIRWLFTSEPTMRVGSIDTCTVIGRYTLRTADPPHVAAALVGAAEGARRKQWLAWNTKKIAKAVGGRAYHRLRELVFREGQFKVSPTNKS
jgi:peptidoglycan/xylan/chitin deacetylase (PgdA/CDA1 family)